MLVESDLTPRRQHKLDMFYRSRFPTVPLRWCMAKLSSALNTRYGVPQKMEFTGDIYRAVTSSFPESSALCHWSSLASPAVAPLLSHSLPHSSWCSYVRARLFIHTCTHMCACAYVLHVVCGYCYRSFKSENVKSRIAVTKVSFITRLYIQNCCCTTSGRIFP